MTISILSQDRSVQGRFRLKKMAVLMGQPKIEGKIGGILHPCGKGRSDGYATLV